MKRFRVIVYIAVYSFVWHFCALQPVVYAQESLGESIDCTDVRVDYSDDSTLTRAERLRLMDKAFFESLNKFELCQSAKKMAEAASVAGGGGGGGEGAEDGSGDTGGEAGTASTGESIASSTMSGTEAPKEIPPAGNIEAGESEAKETPRGMDVADNTKSGSMTSSNGKLPEDIPSADNDDALAAQIRYAAEIETDSVKKEKLWNEYRKYKGLVPKK